MANMGSQGILKYIDNPANSIVSATEGSTVTWAVSSDTNDTAIVRAVAAGKGLHYAGALYATDDNLIEFCSNNLNFTAQEGHCSVEAIIQLSTMVDVAFNFGFNDDVLDAGNTLPMELTGTTISATATAFVGLIYDDDSTDPDNIYCAWVNGGTVGQTDSAGQIDGQDIKMDGVVPTAAKWFYMKVSLDDRGSGNGARATFLVVDHNGVSKERTFNTSITRSTPLCFYLGVENRDALARNLYIRCPGWEQTIPDM